MTQRNPGGGDEISPRNTHDHEPNGAVADEPTPPRSPRRESAYYIIGGRRAFCVMQERNVSVHYDDGGWTSAYYDTFDRWGATLATDQARKFR
jgi:hypothetical protein